MATKPKAKPKRGAARPKGSQRSKQEKRDDDVMNTNDSSIVSKRCVSKLYLSDEPDFYEPFVPKFVRRNPLINRGYWLRMHAIEQVVRRFLEEDNGKPKIVVNLGCGYDPLPFQFWHRYASLTKNATFVDVDYPQLIEKKRDRMLTNGLLREALLKTKLRSSEQPVYLRSDQYMAIGCDLRDLDLLERTLRAELAVSSSSVIFVAEVSATYMPVVDSDALIRWASTLEDARFCILEQYLPQGPDHPFARTMLSHFKKLQASIYAIERYLTLEQQSSRFLCSGWSGLDIVRNLWDLWSDDAFTAPALRRKLDTIEPFDEWEEFALFGGHYFLLVARNTDQRMTSETSGVKAATTSGCIETTDAESINVATLAKSPVAALTPRRFTAAFNFDKDSIAVHGGQGSQSRLSTVDVLTREDRPSILQPCTSLTPPARMCHTITSIKDGTALLVGGRGSPTQALNDAWLIKDGSWSQVDGLAVARYRHCAVALESQHDLSGVKGVLLFGGKASDGTVLDDWMLWSADNGWRSIPVDGPRPSARFGAVISTMGSASCSGLLLGGMCADGTVLEDVWEWSFCATPTLRLTFIDRTNETRSNFPNATYARIGAHLVPWSNDSALLIGGVSKKGIHSSSEDLLLLTHKSTRIDVHYPVIHPPSPWPLLVGMGVVAHSQDEILIAGGGAVCFSMGSFWNEGYLTITKAGTQGAPMWRKATHQDDGTVSADVPTSQSAPLKSTTKKAVKSNLKRPVGVTRMRLHTRDEFAQVVHASKPVVIEGLDIGPCTGLWTLDYLKDKLGPERELVVHECSSDRMTFKNKNFEYVKKSVADFLDGIGQGSQEYLRSVSSSQPNKLPTKLEEDFPTIASDFQIPDICDEAKSNLHSSPLRISGPVSLWLHYDVLANVLCQIRGRKTLYLFPPTDAKHLDYPAGGSSSNTDVLTSKDPKLRSTHPHIAHLKPGDILFIPPMWSHTATPEDGVSVAVNVFWKNLAKGYAAGKDVYGNRDLQAYENGRRDVEKIVRAFRDVPADIAKFYLDRLAGEVQEQGEKIVKKAREASKESAKDSAQATVKEEPSADKVAET